MILIGFIEFTDICNIKSFLRVRERERTIEFEKIYIVLK